MALHRIVTAFLLIFVVFIFKMDKSLLVNGAPSPNSLEAIHRHKSRPLLRILPNSQYPRLKADFTDFIGKYYCVIFGKRRYDIVICQIVDDDDFFELSKRQTSDDYGHLRFGKRGDEQFDDYGHMRFGRNGASN